MFRENTACAEQLLLPARRILKEENAIKRLPVEERIRLWNTVEENFTKYRDGACGKFLSDLDNHIRSHFMVSQIILAITFEEKGEPFKPSCICSDRDFEIYRKISGYNMFEILSPADVRKKLEHNDDEILTLLSNYYYEMEQWVSSTVADATVDLPIRYFLKRKWEQYRRPIDQALCQNPERWMHLISRHHERTLREMERIKEVISKKDEEVQRIDNERKEKEDEIRNLRSVADRLKQDLAENLEEIGKHKKMLEESSLTLAERERLIEQQKMDFAAQEEEIRSVIASAAINNRELEKKAEEIRAKKQELEVSEQQILSEKMQIDAAKTELEQVSREIARKEQEFQEKERALDEKTHELDQVRQKWNTVQESGSRFVSTGDVKQYEMNFIGRTELKIGSVGNRIKITGRTFIVDAVSEKKDVAEKIRAKVHNPSGTSDTPHLPENRSIVANLTEGKLLGEKTHYTFRAQFLSRPANYARFGFDSEPLTMQDLHPLLVDARDHAMETNTPIFLCIASPTGFSSEVNYFLNNAEMHKNFLSKHLSVCFVDLETAQLIYNPADEVVKSFLPWCEMVFEQEKIEKARQVVRHNIDCQFQRDSYARFDKARKSCKESGISDEEYVKAAFYEYGQEKKRPVKHVESVGLVMME